MTTADDIRAWTARQRARPPRLRPRLPLRHLRRTQGDQHRHPMPRVHLARQLRTEGDRMTTPCHGHADLFEATTLAAHAEAAALCATCPAIEACEALLADTMRDYGYGPNNGPRGTWAGRLVTKPSTTIVGPKVEAA